MRTFSILLTLGVLLVAATIGFDYMANAQLGAYSSVADVSRAWVALSGIAQAVRVIGAVLIAAAIILKLREPRSGDTT